MDYWLGQAQAAGVQGARALQPRLPQRVCIEGTVAGRRLLLLRIANGDMVYSAIEVPLDPPLDLGLRAQPRGFGRGGRMRMRSGHADLDAEYSFHADDAARLESLFHGPVSERLYALHCACMSATLGDATVTISSDWSIEVPWPAAGVHAAVELATLIDEARADVRVSPLLRMHRRPWEQLAARLRGELTTTPLRVLGTLDELAVHACARRTGAERYRLELSVRHAEPFGAGIRISPTRALLDGVGAIFGRQDVRVGDRAFDDAFHIQVTEGREAALVQALNAETRALILTARATGAELVLDDKAARAFFQPEAPGDALPAAVEPLVEASLRLSRALRLGPERSAYRG
ncbi:MAG: hypothetical protein WKG00_14715 [Polyangiaceae bacterium]